jgi:CheY-like chemotaxis protein
VKLRNAAKSNDFGTNRAYYTNQLVYLGVEMAATQSKIRILAGAKELFLARCYAATTVDAICEKAQLTKGSFYYFFDSKEDLGLAVLDCSLRRSAQMLASGPHVGIVDPVEKAFAFLEHLEKCSPELCDVMMPGLDGYGVIAALRADAETLTIPFIFLAVKAEKPDIRAGMNLGADEYLIKPVAKADLLAAIHSRLECAVPASNA